MTQTETIPARPTRALHGIGANIQRSQKQRRNDRPDRIEISEEARRQLPVNP